MDGKNQETTRRTLEADGVGLVVKTLPELSRYLHWLADEWTRRHKKDRKPSSGESRSHSYYIGRALCWLAKRHPADLDRIQREGDVLFEDLRSRPQHPQGHLPESFDPDTKIVLVPEGAPDGRPGTVRARPIGVSTRRRKDRRREGDAASDSHATHPRD